MQKDLDPHLLDRPLPTPNAYSAPFWDACRRHELLLQRCSHCGTFRYYPRPRCPQCLSGESEWRQVSGLGTVYSFTVVHRPLTNWFKDKVPLVVVVVELSDGVRMIANLIGLPPEAVHVGLPVVVDFEDVNEEVTLPTFRPRKPER